MNEQIEKLLNEATSGHEQETDRSKIMCISDKEMEMFAELIVKECMSLVSEPGPDMNDTERGILAQIKEHFGVEA